MKWLAALAVMLVTGPATAQPTIPIQCMSRATIVTQLAEHYKEAPISRGQASGGAMLEVFANDSRSSWTLVLTTPNGMGCVVAEGSGWSTLPPHPGREVDDHG